MCIDLVIRRSMRVVGYLLIFLFNVGYSYFQTLVLFYSITFNRRRLIYIVK